MILMNTYEWTDLYHLMQTPGSVGPAEKNLNINHVMFKYTHISSIKYRRMALYKKFDGTEEIVDLVKLELQKKKNIIKMEEDKRNNSATLYYDDGRIDKVIPIINNSTLLPSFVDPPIKSIQIDTGEELRYYANGSIDKIISIKS